VRVGETVTLGIRPDHVKVSAQGTLTGRIALVEELGENHLLYVDIGQGRPLTIREPGDAQHKAGQQVGLLLAEESCHLFKDSGEALPLLSGSRSPVSPSPDPSNKAA
jgi:multiple sugar transport system ATP-binding protein